MANKHLGVLHGFTKKIIQERKGEMKISSEDHDEDDLGIKKRIAFLDLLIKSSEDGAVLSDKDIQEEVDTFMFEGHDTTAAAMSFMVHSLGADANRCKKVQAELDENLTNVDDDDSSFYEKVENFDIDHKDLEKIEYGAWKNLE